MHLWNVNTSRLVITRSDERVFHIGDDISIHVTTNQWGHTKLTIDAPRGLSQAAQAQRQR